MKPEGIFLFIDDDPAEHTSFKSALKSLGISNEVVSAYNGEKALNFLKEFEGKIFLVISDLNMPKMNGLELKHTIEGTPELKLKSIPFIFHSTADIPIIVKEAYLSGIQGFLKKSDNIEELVKNLDIIIKFWSTIVHPNSVN